MNELQAAGVKVITPLRAVPGIVKVGFVEDPWGVKIELLQDAETLGFHHVHLLAPDPVASMAWSKERFGGETAKLNGVLDGLKYGDVWVFFAKGDDLPSAGHAIDHVGWRVPDLDRTLTGLKAKNIKVVQGPTTLTLATGVVHYSSSAPARRGHHLKAENVKPSAGTAIDHIGFSFADADAKMNELQAAGVRVITPLRAVPGIVKVGFVEDPWGVKIELLQDAETLGFHHVHLLAPDPAASMAWYKERFGGETAKLKGVLDGLEYGDVWVLVAKGDATPSVGHAIDHVGWRVTDLDKTLTGLKAKNIKVVQGPTALTLATGVVHYSFVEDPSGTKIEIVQR